jgi:predicted ATP-dependent serine protease
MITTQRRGRPKSQPTTTFNSQSIRLFRGSDLKFNDSLFVPLKTNTPIDYILSTEGGIMPGTNLVFAGGPGSGKSTITLDILAKLTVQGYKCLFVSGEMDEIAHYKYCKRMPAFSCVQTLFLKNYSATAKETLEHVFSEGYDIVAIDSIAEVIEMIKDNYKMTEGASESWFLNLQDQNKKGLNKNKYYTSFINIQQVTKAGEFSGSNRLKHMTDGMCHIERSKDGLERSMHFSKNRDCDNNETLYFTFNRDQVAYSHNQI